MEMALIYLYGTVENIQSFTTIFATLFIAAVVVCCCMSFMYEDYFNRDRTDKFRELFRKSIKPTFIGALLFSLLSIFTPSKESVAMMFVYPIMKQGAAKVMESGKIDKISTIIDKYLDEKIESFKGE